MNKKKILNDPVYGFITIPSERLFDLIEHRYFQRLRRIKQLGFTHYVYPGALHTRFHHALGAMHLMQMAIATLRSKDVEITDEEAEASMMAILLHDIGHGPYSHTLEYVLVNAHHETMTGLFLDTLNREFNGMLDMAIAIFKGSYHKFFLHQLVSSQLDLDRLDYLKRDSFFTGVAEGNIGHDRIIKMLNVVDDQVVIEEKGIYSVENFLVARRLMYWQVYLHKTVIGAEQMLRKMLLLTRDALRDGKSFNHLPGDVLYFLSKFPDLSELRDEVLARFARIDDVDIVYTLKLLATHDDPVISFLASSILNRKLFRTELFPQAPDPGYADSLVSRVSKQLPFGAEDVARLIIPGHEIIPTYRTANEEIMMLKKDGQLIPLSNMLNIQQDAVSETYFLCYPKV